ncbi:MAG: hypothetical protein AAF724_00975 [Pseudomonadota bacterium]
MRMFRRLVVLLSVSLLAGCVTSAVVPEDYSGPTALIEDSSGEVVSPSSPWFSPKRLVEPQKADLFYVYQIDGKRVDNIAYKTEMLGGNSGFRLRLYPVERKVPIRTMKVTLAGLTYYAAPIGEMFNDVYRVSGDVDFTPVAGETYIVRGVLGKDYSAVWIETDEGSIVTQKVENKVGGDAAATVPNAGYTLSTSPIRSTEDIAAPTG